MNIDLGAINYIAVVVAVVATQLIGAVWYSVLFSKAWMAEIGVTPEQMKARGAAARTGYAMAILGSLIATWVLAMLVQATGAGDALDGIILGLMAGGGFVATAVAVNYVFESRSLRLFLINAGYPVIGLVVSGVILALWD